MNKGKQNETKAKEKKEIVNLYNDYLKKNNLTKCFNDNIHVFEKKKEPYEKNDQQGEEISNYSKLDNKESKKRFSSTNMLNFNLIKETDENAYTDKNTDNLSKLIAKGSMISDINMIEQKSSVKSKRISDIEEENNSYIKQNIINNHQNNTLIGSINTNLSNSSNNLVNKPTNVDKTITNKDQFLIENSVSKPKNVPSLKNQSINMKNNKFQNEVVKQSNDDEIKEKLPLFIKYENSHNQCFLLYYTFY